MRKYNQVIQTETGRYNISTIEMPWSIVPGIDEAGSLDAHNDFSSIEKYLHQRPEYGSMLC